MIGRGRPYLSKNLANTDPPADCRSIFARSASAVLYIAKRVQLTVTGSPLRAFQ